jgi:hypothetical protein
VSRLLTPGTYAGAVMFCRCGHCKRMVGEYKTLGELVQSDPALKGRVVVAKVGTAVEANRSCIHSTARTACKPAAGPDH